MLKGMSDFELARWKGDLESLLLRANMEIRRRQRKKTQQQENKSNEARMRRNP